MVRDYKITTLVDKNKYLALRGRLMLEGKSFSEWLDEKLTSLKEPTVKQQSLIEKAEEPFETKKQVDTKIHFFGEDGKGFCFRCNPPHKQEI